MRRLVHNWMRRLVELDELLSSIERAHNCYEMFKLAPAAGRLWNDYAHLVHQFNTKKFWWMRRRWVRM